MLARLEGTRPKQPLPADELRLPPARLRRPGALPDRHPNPVHKSLEANWEDALAMHRAAGFGRGVFVQPANYVTDHTYLKKRWDACRARIIAQPAS